MAMKNLWKKIEEILKFLFIFPYLYNLKKKIFLLNQDLLNNKNLSDFNNSLSDINNLICSSKNDNNYYYQQLTNNINEVKRYISVLHGTNGQNVVFQDTVVKELLASMLDFLKIITEFCDKHEIKYWLDFGGLLGFVRNGGVIPWDDDIDISMLKEDFDKFFDLFSKEVNDINSNLYNKIEIYFHEWKNDFSAAGRQLRITNDKSKAIFFDIFLYDSLPFLNESEIAITKNEITEIIKTVTLEDCMNIDKLHSKLTYYNKNSKEKSLVFLSPITPVYQPLIHNYEDIFPLKKVMFEGISVYIPNKERIVLVNTYNNYWDIAIKQSPSKDRNKNIVDYLDRRKNNA
jgi:lipopolysaccharide cholinephosphotransferase